VRNNKIISLGIAALLLGGCTMIPKYQRPEAPVPAALPGGTAAPAGAAAASATTGLPAASELAWQEFFTDPGLRAVIELALANNRDLRIAALNVDRMQAFYRIQRSNLYPSVAAVAGAESTGIPRQMSSTDESYTVGQYSVLGTASWELDLFGRLRSQNAKALDQFLATVEGRKATQISLVAAVANGYLLLAADRESLDLARATLEAQKTSYDLIQKSRDAGVASDLTLSQAQSQVEAARVDVARYSGFVATDINALNLLAGTQVPGELLPGGLAAVAELRDISAGLDSEILLQRPDIVAAEYRLKGANANIGAARAAFFPRISLTGALGTLAPGLSNLFQSGTGAWSYSAQIAQPIFAGGALKANLKGAKVDRDIAVAEYEKAIQTAFRETGDALALRSTLVDQLDAQQSLVGALDKSYRLSEALFKEGIDSYLGVLINQRSLYLAQRSLVATRLARRSNQVTLYKVLGGGL
jgi:multidrug efflux system outer membrane protein